MKSLLFAFCLFTGFNITPNIEKVPNCLFFIERSTNKNIVIYESNFDEFGYLISEDPIKISWIMNEKNGEREKLSYIERKLAYGIKVIKLKNNKHKIILTADKSRDFILEQIKPYQAKITSTINDTIIRVNSLYIELNKESTWPKVDYIILSGIETLTNTETSRKLFIK